eukprot:1160277-Pelagomonas_calceolata.AAC.8
MLFSIARACCAGWPPVKRDRPSRPPSLSRSRSATLTLLPRVWPGAWGMESTSALMKKELRRSSSYKEGQEPHTGGEGCMKDTCLILVCRTTASGKKPAMGRHTAREMCEGKEQAPALSEDSIQH